jgi:cell division septation protein DedD
MADEGLHEIQLNGKQLVFLFMASTVVAVVIFLCGVMVGRGVRALRPADTTEASIDSVADPTVVTSTSSAPAAQTAATTGNTPVASQETLTYPSRLEGQEPAEETLKDPTRLESPAPKAVTLKATRPASTATPVVQLRDVTPPSSDVSREPAGNGFVVQVAAVNDRREAESIARRLSGKGYPSFVTTPPNGTPKMFRVRIGKYPTRREAETIAARLEKEDQFKPWVTR